MKLQGKSVVVTGASAGMGKAIVELFAQQGANVVAVARRAERLEELAKACAGAPGKVVPFVGDVSKEADVVAALQKAKSEFGRLDVLVNNAGIMDGMEPIGMVENERMERVFSVNVYGPIYAMREAVRIFKEQGEGGNIINVASVGALRTVAGAVYCASKAAIVSLSKNTAHMYLPDKIRCNVIAPGGIRTEIQSSMGVPNTDGYARLAPTFATAPAPGEASHIAQAALFLASDDSSYISGDVLVVDGGWIAG